MKSVNLKAVFSAVVLSVALIGAQPAHAAFVDWVDWTSFNATTVNGNEAVHGVNVTFTGDVFTSATQVSGGTNFWGANPVVFTSPGIVDNAPDNKDIIALTGGPWTGVQKITFSKPVTDPVMAISSLGREVLWHGPIGSVVDYNFDADFDILNYGPGFWGGNGYLKELPGNVLRGEEGEGIIQFKGTLSSISWTVPVYENWHGFTIGLPESSVVPEPMSMMLLGSGLLGAGILRRKK